LHGYSRRVATLVRPAGGYVVIAALVLLALGAMALLRMGDASPDIGGPGRDLGPGGSAAAASLPPPIAQSRGATREVAPNGNDANPGTPERPWRTVQKAFRSLRPGETAIVRAGTYTADHVMRRAGTAKAPITVKAAPGERPVLHAASTSGDTYPVRFTDAAAYVRLSGFLIEGAKGISSTNVYFEGDVHHIELSRNEIRYSQDQGVFAERTTRHLRILANRVHDNGRGHKPGQHQSHGLYIEGANHLIANNVVHDHPYGFGMQLYPANHDTTVVNNTIVRSGHSGIVMGGDDGVYNMVVRNNILASNGKYGVEMDSDCPSRSAVDTNVLHDNDDGGVDRDCGGVDVSRGNIGANPRFADPGAGDYGLRPGSPALDRARAAFAPRTDFTGRRRPQGRGFDIGAYELAR
jgi:hypothetical protein